VLYVFVSLDTQASAYTDCDITLRALFYKG